MLVKLLQNSFHLYEFSKKVIDSNVNNKDMTMVNITRK